MRELFLLISVLALLVLLSAAGQIHAATTSENDLWQTHQVQVGGMNQIQQFTMPRLDGEVCVSLVTIEDSSQGAQIYYAFPLNDSRSCDGLTADRDFFPAQLFSNDREFLDVFKHAAEFLRRLPAIPSDKFDLQTTDLRELADRQMSALSSFSLSRRQEDAFADRYDFSLNLSQSLRFAVLSVNRDGSDPEIYEVIVDLY